MRIGQLIAVEVALAVALAALLAGPIWAAAATPGTVVMLAMSVVRTREKWAYEWLRLAVGYGWRAVRGARRRVPDPNTLLASINPGSAISVIDMGGVLVGAVLTAGGTTVLIEIGDSWAVLPPPGAAMPSLASLAKAAEPHHPQVRLQLVAAAAGTPADGPAASAYRQLTGAGLASYRRTVLALQARRALGHTEADLRRVLASTAQRVCRRLERAGLTATPLDPAAAAYALAELAHLHPPTSVVESWPTVNVGGWQQVTFRLTAASRSGTDTRVAGLAGSSAPGLSLPARLLNLPGCAVTVALSHEAGPLDTYVRLAAATPAALDAAVTALRGHALTAGVRAERLDGSQLRGLAETLPIGAMTPIRATATIESHDPTDHTSTGHSRTVATRLPQPEPVALEPALTGDGAGVVLGTNRQGAPVLVRLFRRRPTRLVLIGAPNRAQLVALRALAIGAFVCVQTTRPDVWSGFLRAVGGPGTRATLAPPRLPPPLPSPSPTCPQLVVIDTPDQSTPRPELPWRTTLVIRDQLSPGDVDLLSQADLALLPPISEAEAALAGSALGLGDTASWLARIRGDMIGLIAPRQAVRWALATPTRLEGQLLGHHHPQRLG